jgi:D-3-phosphoglycerate dehydrogenase
MHGPQHMEKLTEVNGFDIDVSPEAHLLFFTYLDRPGVVGAVGAQLGAASVNIAGAQVSRTRRGGAALMALSVDQAVPQDLLHQIAQAIGAFEARTVGFEQE